MKKHLTLAVSIGALVCACVVGMTALWDLPVLAKERHALIATGDGWQEEDIATADGWQDKDIVDEEEVDAGLVSKNIIMQNGRLQNGNVDQEFELDNENGVVIDNSGKYLIRQVAEEVDNSIYINKDCDIWLDGINGNISIQIEKFTQVRIHLLSDCTIGGITFTGGGNGNITLDSTDLSGNKEEKFAFRSMWNDVSPLHGAATIKLKNVDFYMDINNRYEKGELGYSTVAATDIEIDGGSINGYVSVGELVEAVNGGFNIKPQGKLTATNATLNLTGITIEEAVLENCVLMQDERMDMEVTKLSASNIDWNVEGFLDLYISGTIKDSTLNLSKVLLTDSQLKLENCKVTVQTPPENMEDDTEDNRMPIYGFIDVETWKKDCKLTFSNCDVSAWNIGCSGQDGFRGSIVFDNSDLDMQNTEEFEGVCGIDISGTQSEVGNAVGEGTLEIKNKSNVTIKTNTRGIQLYNNAILSISDSEVVIDGGLGAVFGSTEWEDGTHKNDIPQLKLLDGVVIREGGKWFSYMHETDDEGWTEHEGWIGSSSEPSKHVEIGKPKETGGSGSGNGGSSSSGSSSSGGTTNTVVSNIMTITAPSITEGTWEKQGNIWKLKKADGLYATGQWALLDGKWYLLNQQGSMVIGWQQVNGVWYAFGVDGSMLTGWQMINDKWYYLDANGAMLANTTTPDGHQVGSSGERIS